MARPEHIAALARRGEYLGFAYAGVSDHVVIPHGIQSRYPYGYREGDDVALALESQTGRYGGSGECLETLALLSFVAAHTSRVRLVSSVLVLPYRGPVLTAKILASIDVLSNGRLILGCGVGWMREEFELLGSPPYEERGAVGDEYLRAFKELWTSDAPTFEGRYVSFSDLGFTPKPVQKPHPPIWVGGESPPALRRAARLGDGWYPIGTNPLHPVGTVAQLSDSISRLRRYAEEVGRDPAEISIAYNGSWSDDTGDRTGDGRLLFSGTPEQVAGDIRAFQDMGVGHIGFGFDRPTLSETIERMERFATDVMPLV